MKKMILVALATVGCALLAQQAHAFTGSVQFTGTASPNKASSASATVTVSFTNPWTILGGTQAPTGVYAGSDGTAANMSTFQFTGTGTGATLVAPVSPEWSFVFGGHTYTFDLVLLTNGHTQSGSMSFSGTGTAFIDGGQASAAFWSLQGSAASGFTFRLSSATTAAAPDGGSAVALLGLAFAGIEGTRRLLRGRKA